MSEITISKPIFKILSHLTGEDRIDVALPLATKDLLRLRLKESEGHVKQFEQRYKMSFSEFKIAWESGKINNKYSYQVEKDYWEWEAAVTDQQQFRTMLEELP
jgi:hypothetical protein